MTKLPWALALLVGLWLLVPDPALPQTHQSAIDRAGPTSSGGATPFALTFTPDGKTLIAGCEDHVIRLWDVESGKVVSTLEGHVGLECMAISPDGKTLASGGIETIKLWDVSDPKKCKELATIKAHPNQKVYSLVFFPDGKTLASVGYAGDGNVKVWDVGKRAEIATLRGTEDGHMCALAISPDGKTLA